MGHDYKIPKIKASENPMRSISKIVKEQKKSEKLILVKREDLEWLLRNIGHSLSWYYLEKVKKLKEKYKIE